MSRGDKFRTIGMTTLAKIAVLFVVFAVVVSAGESAAQCSIRGYYKSFFVAYDSPKVDDPADIEQQPLLGSVSNRLRVNLVYHAGDRMSLAASYNFIPRIQDKLLFKTGSGGTETGFPIYRADDFNSRLYPGRDADLGNVGVFHNLDRFFLTINSAAADIYIGRQAIAWGSARGINPTDILAPYAFDELDTEDRIGVDAIRVRAPLGFMGEIDGGYVCGKDFSFDQSAIFLRGKFYAASTDISPMIVGFREHLMLGIDITRSVGGASGWLEGAYVFVDALTDRRTGSGEDYGRITVGLDYMLTGTVYAFAEYHFSQAGTGNADRYSTLSEEPAYTDGAVYLLGRHYFIPGVSWQITPLLTMAGQVLVNLEDHSLYLAPQLEYNVAQNVYLSAGGFIGLGRRPYNQIGLDSSPHSPIYRSEFGGYSDMYFTSFRVYY